MPQIYLHFPRSLVESLELTNDLLAAFPELPDSSNANYASGLQLNTTAIVDGVANEEGMLLL